MALFIARRVLYGFLTILIMSFIAFTSVYLVGNPLDLLMDPSASVAERELTAHALGLDRSIPEQYLTFIINAVHLDFGKSFTANMPAGALIMERLPATVELTFSAMIISILVGIPLGIAAGLYPRSLIGKTIMSGSILGFSLPGFWVGLMLIMIFSVTLGWLPSTGRGPTVRVVGIDWAFFTWDGIRHLILPSVTLALANTAMLIRLVRAGLREVMLQDFIKYARAKGLDEKRVVWVHAMGNILIPVITVIGLDVAMLLAGSIVVETVFAYPGIGRLAIDAISYVDRPVIVTYILFVATAFVVLNLIVDIGVAFADPRVSHTGSDK